MVKKLLLALGLGIASAQAFPRDTIGNGLTKSTYASSDPFTGLDFLLNYFPVLPSPDSCQDNTCICDVDGDTFPIQQGRVQLEAQSTEGFGLHLVNVSGHVTTGGMTVQEVEAEFTSKLDGMSQFDWFMDYSVSLYTTDLDSYISSFESDSVDYFPTTWSDSDGVDWYGVFVQVPGSQMVLELSSNTSTLLRHRHSKIHRLEQRISDRSIAQIRSSTSSSLTVLSVNRAASDIDAVEDFYVNGMKTVLTLTVNSTLVQRRCFLWVDATAELCFTNRPDFMTSGDFLPKDFEDMLNSVHEELLYGQPNCGMDKWLDNHYAVDTTAGAGVAFIVTYLEDNPSTYYFCQSGKLHYVVDPTGWGFQTDMNFQTQPSGCVDSGSDDNDNPACSPGICNE